MLSIFNNKYLLSTIKKGITILGSVLATTLIARYLSPELKGQYVYFISIMNIAVIFAEFGLFKLYSKAKKDNISNSNNDFFTLFILKFIFLFLIALILIFIFPNSNIEMKTLPFMICLNTFQAELLFMLLIDRFNYSIFISSFSSIFYSSLLLIIYFFTQRNLSFIMWSFLLKDTFICILCIIFGGNKFHLSKKVYEIVKDNISIILYPILSSLLLDFNYKVDIFFLKEIADNYIVGIYSSAVNLTEITWIIPDIFKEVLFNKTANSNAIESINACIRFTNLIVICLILIVSFFGKTIIHLLFGYEYLRAYKSVLILLLGVHSMAIFKILNPLYQTTGRWKLYTYTLFFGTVLNMLLNYFLIPLISERGAAIASVFSYLICGGVLIGVYVNENQIKIKNLLLPNMKDYSSLFHLFQSKRVCSKETI